MPGVIRQKGFRATDAFSLRDFAREADDVLAAARREADDILAQAKETAAREAEAARAAAHAEGLAAGQAQGRKEAREQAAKQALEESRAGIKSLVDTITAIATRFDDAKRRLLAEAEHGVIELTVRIADRVCRLRVAADSDVAVAQARELLELARGRHDALIRIAPADEEAVRRVTADLAAHIDELEHVALVVDDQLSAGDCMLTSREGEIDLRLQTAIDRVATALLGAPLTPATESSDG